MKTRSIFLLLFMIPVLNAFPQAGLNEIHSWAYQLQNIDLIQVVNNTTFELFVMDYSEDGSDTHKFTQEQISQIQTSGKKVLAYISIGEAEDYRFYWNPDWDRDSDGVPDFDAPAWLGPENQDWEGNYKVRFWDPQWQDIVFAYVDTILSQGFDGIYCDIIDAYYYWSEEIQEEPLADAYMIQFVLNIRDHIAQITGSDFFIVPQNGEFLIEEVHVTATMKDDYLNTIHGIGVEDVFFPGDLDENNPWDPDTERIEMLDEYLGNGIPVFSVEYLTDAGLIDQYISAAMTKGYVPYTSTRALDVLYDGISTVVNENRKRDTDPSGLFQIYPNPMNGSIWIRYSVEEFTDVRINLYNIKGQLIRTLMDDYQKPGYYSIRWNGRDKKGHSIPSGLYFITLFRRGSQPLSKRLIILK